MSTNPFESLPPAPDDLWPKVSALNPSVPSQLISEAFPAPLSQVTGILGRAVHLEMQSSGEYAAKAVMPPLNLRPHEAHVRGIELRFHGRLHAETAARLLHSYGIIHPEVLRQGPSSLPTPAQLKESATRTYRHQIEALKVEQPGFNDELFGQLKNKTLGQGAKYHR
jgi:hypothetical protein